MISRETIISLLFLLSLFSLKAQVRNTRLNNQANLQYEISDSGSRLHTSIKPFLHRDISDPKLIDSIESSVLNLSKDKFSIQINPVLQLQYLYEFPASQGNFLKEGGLRFDADLGKKLSLSSNLLAGSSEFVSFQDSMIRSKGIIPGIGSAYGNEKYSYQEYRGYLSYSPNKIFNFQAGKDKHFFGDGYRSLFLSDVSPAFAFGKITANVWKLKYVCLYGFFKDIGTEKYSRSNFKNKYGSFHYLSWNATKKINLSFFESVIWQGTDSGRTRGYDINYLNPVIFFRPVEYSLGSSDNSCMGFSFKWRFYKKYSLYGQLMLDEFLLKEIMARKGWWANKYGIQSGIKCFDLFNVKNLVLQGELNYVRPYTYSHASVQQNYGHFNQALAHPLGANFIESVSILSYRYERWSFQGKIIFTNYGADLSESSNVGQDIFKSYSTRGKEYGNYTGQGISTTFVFIDAKADYLIDKRSGLKAEAGASLRINNSAVKNSENIFVYFGIKTLLSNFYNDY